MARRRALFIVAGCALLVVFAWPQLSISTSITHFLPGGEEGDRVGSALTQSLANARFSRSVTLLLSADSEDGAVRAASTISEQMRESELFDWVRAPLGEAELEEAVRALYLDRSRELFSPAADPDGWSDADLDDAAVALRNALGRPDGSLARAVAPKDPFLTFPKQLDRMLAARVDGLRVRDGQLLTRMGQAVVFASTAASAFDGASARAAVAVIDRAAEQARAEVPTLTIQQGGVHRFALASETNIRQDVSLISTVSTVGVILLFLFLFRSPGVLIVSILPVACGFAVALVSTALAFGAVHGLTLAFGAALIGVCVDYSLHVASHHAFDPAADRVALTRAVWPGLALGAGTTVAGLLGLAGTAFPGLRQIALFACAGVVTALFATRYVAIPLLPASEISVPVRGLAERLTRFASPRRPTAHVVIGLMAVTLALVGIPRLDFIDDVSALDERDPAIVAEDEAVRAVVSGGSAGRLIISRGETVEDALAINDQVALALADRDGVAVQSVHTYLWSEAAQRRSFERMSGDDFGRRTLAALSRAGFREELFAPFQQELAREFDPLRLEDVNQTALGQLISPFFLTVAEQPAVLTLVTAGDADVIQRAVRGVPGARYFEQRAFLNAAYRGFRVRAIEMGLLGLVFVFLLVLARYRALRPALAAYLPALLAGAAATGCLGVLGVPVTLLHLVALLLVLSIGVDYGIFVVEHAGGDQSSEHLRATLLGIAAACVTTTLSFGTLALSSQPALHAIGVTVGIGVVLAWLLAPLGVSLLTRAP